LLLQEPFRIMDQAPARDAFADIIDGFTAAPRAALATALHALSPQLAGAEATLIHTAGAAALYETARLKLSRVLLLELHAAGRAGQLDAADEPARFAQFLQLAQDETFLAHLDRRYPPLRRRLAQALEQQQAAIATLAARLAADRAALAPLLGQPAGPLLGLSLGQGDLHAGGQSVARLTLQGGQLMYKPRSLRSDQVLDALLAQLFGASATRIRVPAVLDRGGYGWAAFVPHRYCENEDELRQFYRGLGHWLGVLRLVGGVDIHQENLIAAGPVPVVIDAESLFADLAEDAPSGHGQAYDLANSLIQRSVLRTGIVPFRMPALGLSGVDLSAAGALPGQQPQVHAPVIAAAGTTAAHLQVISVERGSAQNHPSPQPDVARYWDQLSEGFLEVTTALRRLDAEDALAPLLAAFEGCPVRDIRRPTQAYVEIARMLWHPASLHDEAAAVARARDLLTRNAAVAALAPSDPALIAAEVRDLLVGDLPLFVETLSSARIAASLADWRGMRLDLEELTVRCALAATWLNHREDDPTVRDELLYFARNPHAQQLEQRRRRLAAEAVQRLLRLAVHGGDGTVTWITPETSAGGWLVQPLQHDVYFGLGGVAVALAGYAHETAQGRAAVVPGLDAAVAGALRVLEALDETGTPAATVGGFSGHAARIWTWLSLHDLRQQPDYLDRAQACAAALEQAGFIQDICLDLIDGSCGAVVPLLELAETTGQARWRELAAQAGRHIAARAIVDEQGARWQTLVFGQPIGGFAHGAAGFGWALTRLVLAGAGTPAEQAQWQALATQAFAFQDALYDEDLGNWLDIRQREACPSFHTWCNGSVGIGLAAADLYRRTGAAQYRLMLRRAVRASQGQWGAGRSLCHGDFSLCELFLRAAALDPQGCGADCSGPVAEVVSAIEEHGPGEGGLARSAFTPGLMTGLAGAVHGLCRLHTDCELASPLLLERRALQAADQLRPATQQAVAAG
jgi:type 2 lantibiotic biosynthesis protein LanM